MNIAVAQFEPKDGDKCYNLSVIEELTKEKIKLSSGYRYINARRPELYKDIIGMEHRSKTIPIWLNDK